VHLLVNAFILVLLITPKLPELHGFRFLGINKREADTD
jgi:hypothetical protein